MGLKARGGSRTLLGLAGVQREDMGYRHRGRDKATGGTREGRQAANAAREEEVCSESRRLWEAGRVEAWCAGNGAGE